MQAVDHQYSGSGDAPSGGGGGSAGQGKPIQAKVVFDKKQGQP
jgi:hypothetical protein